MTAPATPLVGRERERDLLLSTFDRVRRESSTQLVTIAGVPGIGKSRLVAELYGELEAAGQLVLRYAEDCNGSVGDVAGVCNEARNILGLMPHPEHAVDPLLGSGDGALLLAALLAGVDGSLDSRHLSYFPSSRLTSGASAGLTG